MTSPVRRGFSRTAVRSLVTLVLFGAVVSLSSLTCVTENGAGTTSGYDSLSWNREVHLHGDSSRIITVTHLWGPEGAEIDDILPGEYVAQGTYNLEGSPYTTGVIFLNFNGQLITVENGRVATNLTYTIPEGSVSGTYTVFREFFQLLYGTGNPMVEFKTDEIVRDRVTLY